MLIIAHDAACTLLFVEDGPLLAFNSGNARYKVKEGYLAQLLFSDQSYHAKQEMEGNLSLCQQVGPPVA